MLEDDARAMRGLTRLMLKLPALRGQLQLLSRRDPEFANLCDAFEEATVMLERLHARPDASDLDLVREYEQLCAELEQDVVGLCLSRG